MDEETRRKVAAKHRQVPVPPKVGNAFDEELETGLKLQPFQDADAQCSQNPPQIHVTKPSQIPFQSPWTVGAD